MGGGGGGGEPLVEPPPQETQSVVRTRMAEALSHSLVWGLRLSLCNINVTRSQTMPSGRTCQGSGGGTKRRLPIGRALERMVVNTETVEVATVEPSMGDDAGETVHVEAIGASVQVHVIV